MMLSPYEIEQLANLLAERIEARLAGGPAAEAMMDVHGAAELLACSVPTVERLTRSGVLPSYKLGRLRRYRRDELLSVNRKGGADHA